MSAPGLLTSLRRLLADGLEWAELRAGVLGHDLEFEKLRLLEAAIWFAVAFAAALAGLVMFGLLVLLLAGEAWRVHAAAALVLAFVALAWLAWRTMLARAQAGGRPFATLRDELARDRAIFASAAPAAAAAPPGARDDGPAAGGPPRP